ncbi:MAG TPA: nucleotide exchange factor GrpE [Candidatus Dormibacteraeota bacterium]|nr:nucleotide exchange factor GrpE [Candidatus Dormibacteraeota bacterium]
MSETHDTTVQSAPDATALERELAAAKAKADENYQKYLYAVADLENYKKRIERQFAEIALSGKKAFLERLLPIVDNLERALKVADNVEGLHSGVTQTLRGFESVLSHEGVKALDLVGKPFDPRFAEAVGTADGAGAGENTVVEEVQKAYMIGDDVLREAKVIVAKPAHG